jgi:hypothetical protein
MENGVACVEVASYTVLTEDVSAASVEVFAGIENGVSTETVALGVC